MMGRSPTEFTKQQISQTLLALSTHPEDRGKLVQQGAVRMCLKLSCNIIDSLLASSDKKTVRKAAHTLAKLAISVNPVVAFKDCAISLVSLFISLLDIDIGESELLIFEGLLALTK